MADSKLGAKSVPENTRDRIHAIAISLQGEANRIRSLLHGIDDATENPGDDSTSRIINFASMGIELTGKIGTLGEELELIGMGREATQ